MSTIEFKLLDLGGGIDAGVVVRLMVADGDVISIIPAVAGGTTRIDP